MPSIIAYKCNTSAGPFNDQARQAGTILLGKTFNFYFQQVLPNGRPAYSPVDVLHNTFFSVSSTPNVFLKHVYEGTEYDLTYSGITTSGNKVKFKYKNPPADAALPKNVKIEPREDAFDPSEVRSFVMVAAFSSHRKNLFADYLATTVDDILAVQSDLDDAMAYTLSALTFSRCK